MEINDKGYRYIRALVDPFNSDPSHNIFSKRAPCNLYKSKKTIFGKVLGTGGVFIAPSYMPYGTAVYQILYTDGSAAITTIPAFSSTGAATTGIASTYLTNTPYTAAQYTGQATRMHRLVSCAVKVKFTGKSEYIGGSAYPFSNQFNLDMAGMTIAQIKMKEDLIKTDFTNQEVCCFYLPYNEARASVWRYYSSGSTGDVLTTSLDSDYGFSMGIFIEAQELSSTIAIPFQIDICCIWEVAGILEKQTSFYPMDMEQFNIVNSILDGPRAWIGSPATVKLNPVDFTGVPCKAFTIGGIFRQDMLLYYVLDIDKPVRIKNESGDVLTSVSKRKAEAFIKDDEEELKDCENNEDSVEYEGGLQIYKGTKSAKMSQDDSENTLLLESIFNLAHVPTIEIQQKTKKRLKISK